MQKSKEKGSLQLIMIEMNDAVVLCLGLGFLLLIGGFIAYTYQYTVWGIPTGIRPYGDLGIALIVVGVISILAGAVLQVQSQKGGVTQERKLVLVPLKKCPKCGMTYSGKDYEHCPKCGTKLEP